MTKTFAILSTKGGTGKTTIAVNLALALHNLGENTLLVDANLSQPSVAYHLPENHYRFTLADALDGKISFSHAINLHPTGLKVVPASHFKGLSKEHNDVFKKLSRSADYVLFDTPPSEAAHVENATDQVIIVTNPQLPALADAYRLLAKNQHKIIAGVILNKVGKHDLTIDQVEKFLGVPVVASIPYDDKFNKALSERTPFIEMFPKHKYSKTFRELAARLSNKPVNR